MDTQAIFGLQFLMSVVVIGMLASGRLRHGYGPYPSERGCSG
jgi:hypothetical protein